MSPQTSWILNDQIAPRLGSAIPKSVVCVGSEDHNELVQDGLCMSALMLTRVESQGKLGKVSASNIAYYTIQHLKSGRRSTGSSSVDIMASQTQLNGSTKLHSLSEVVSVSEVGDEIYELHDVISSDLDDPAVKAARHLDWTTFCKSLDKLEMLLVQSIINGLTVREICRTVKMTKAKLIELQHTVAAKVIKYMGADILKDIALTPTWRIGLDCEREMMACRAVRRS